MSNSIGTCVICIVTSLESQRQMGLQGCRSDNASHQGRRLRSRFCYSGDQVLVLALPLCLAWPHRSSDCLLCIEIVTSERDLTFISQACVDYR